MPINDYKEITIPVSGTDKAVKMIQDANGNIIWGSQSAFPYRRLEYIDMYGKYYNTYNRPAVGYYYMDVKFDTSNPILSSESYGVFLGSATYTNRLFFQGSASALQYRLKNISTVSIKPWTDLNSNTKYQFRIRNYATNNTAGTWWIALQNLDTNTSVYGQYYNNTTYSMNLSTLPYVHINAHAYNNSGSTSATPQNVVEKGALNFKLYRYFVRESDDSSNIKWDYYPVQRKSDNAVGLYNIKTGSFTHMFNADGTGVYTVTEPIADEYWDLTAPS